MLPIRGAVCYHILPYNIWSLNSDLLLGSNSSQCIQSQTLLRAPVMIHDCNSAPFPADIFLFVTAIPQSDSVFRNSTHPATSMSATMDASGFLAANTVRTHKHSTNPRNVLFSYKNDNKTFQQNEFAAHSDSDFHKCVKCRIFDGRERQLSGWHMWSIVGHRTRGPLINNSQPASQSASRFRSATAADEHELSTWCGCGWGIRSFICSSVVHISVLATYLLYVYLQFAFSAHHATHHGTPPRATNRVTCQRNGRQRVSGI